MAERAYGLLAGFDSPEALTAAAKKIRAAGYRRLDAFTPFPVEGLARILRLPRPKISRVGLIGGFAGGGFALLMQCYVSYDFPLDVGGRPLYALSAFAVVMFELTILFFRSFHDRRDAVAERAAAAELSAVRRAVFQSRDQGPFLSFASVPTTANSTRTRPLVFSGSSAPPRRVGGAMRRMMPVLLLTAIALAGCEQTWTSSPIQRIFKGASVSQQRYCAIRRLALLRGTILRAIRPLRASRPSRRRCLNTAISGSGIFCQPCHGAGGDGNGIIVQRGMPRPTSYHDERLRTADDQYLFDVITKGHGAMYSYASRVPPEDRWAIVAYLRALQLSRHASIDDVPPDQRAQLSGTP